MGRCTQDQLDLFSSPSKHKGNTYPRLSWVKNAPGGFNLKGMLYVLRVAVNLR